MTKLTVDYLYGQSKGVAVPSLDEHVQGWSPEDVADSDPLPNGPAHASRPRSTHPTTSLTPGRSRRCGTGSISWDGPDIANSDRTPTPYAPDRLGRHGLTVPNEQYCFASLASY